jgi:LuxR family transcriptional regulator, quorum-sensing system regulator SdiA
VTVSAVLAAINRTDNAETSEEVTEILQQALASYGVAYHGLVRAQLPHEPLGDALLSGILPDGWAETYVRRKYLLIDPVVRHLGQSRSGFRWQTAAELHANGKHGKRMDRMMADASKAGLKDGYSFPVHGRRGLLAHLSIGGEPVDLQSADLALIGALASKAYWRMADLKGLGQAHPLDALDDIKLTHREMESLHYLADGMTSPEIAAVLEISNHTVDWYMNGIQQKLKAKNRHHAVALAFRLGLVS